MLHDVAFDGGAGDLEAAGDAAGGGEGAVTLEDLLDAG